MSIVITGATGKLGRLTIDALLKIVPANEIVAVVRDREKSKNFEAIGVRVKTANYDDTASLNTVFSTNDTVLLISGTEFGKRRQQHQNVINAARAANISRIVYTSVLGTFLTGGFRLAKEQHELTEQDILMSSIPYTIMRNSWYTENYTEQIMVQLEHGLIGAAGEGKIASASRTDFAEAAAVILTGVVHKNKVYELSGDTAWTFYEYAGEVSRQAGKIVTYTDVTTGNLTDIYVKAGLPLEQAEAFSESHKAIKLGYFSGGSDDLCRLIGRPTTPVSATITKALKRNMTGLLRAAFEEGF